MTGTTRCPHRLRCVVTRRPTSPVADPATVTAEATTCVAPGASSYPAHLGCARRVGWPEPHRPSTNRTQNQDKDDETNKPTTAATRLMGQCCRVKSIQSGLIDLRSRAVGLADITGIHRGRGPVAGAAPPSGRRVSVSHQKPSELAHGRCPGGSRRRRRRQAPRPACPLADRRVRPATISCSTPRTDLLP